MDSTPSRPAPCASVSDVCRSSLSVVRGPGRAHLKCMPQQQLSPEALDLFGAVQPRSGPTRPRRKRSGPIPKLSSLSDAELARLVSDLARELHGRVPSSEALETRPELQRVVQDTASTLARLATSDRERKNRRADRENDEILSTKRKAIRAALLSGVKPMQVAKHFGVSLTIVRQISAGQR